MVRALGNQFGSFTFVSSGCAVNVRLYQEDLEEQFDFQGPMSAEWAWAELDEADYYVDVDEVTVVSFDHQDSNKALGEMAILAMKEVGDRLAPDEKEY